MTKKLSKITSILFISIATSAHALPGDMCLNMMNAHWEGKYTQQYRGDKFTSDATATTSYLRPYHYSMTLNVKNQAPIVLTGTCNENSAIYFENTDGPAPYYLSGYTNGSQIYLSGHHSADGITINLNKKNVE